MKRNKRVVKIDWFQFFTVCTTFFTLGMLLQKIVLCGTSFLSTIGYF